MSNTKPLLNNALIEVMRKDDLVARADENESLRFGRLIDVSVSGIHLTASSGFELRPDMYAETYEVYNNLKGKIVRWEEFAEGGQTFKEDGKTYALIPWWRIIGYEDDQR